MSANHEPLDIRRINPILIGEELHLCQILINILGYAVKFTPNGGWIYFQVKEWSQQSGKSLYRFEIEDTGIGMESSFLNKIWEPFMRGNYRSHNQPKGTGLGMAITRRLVERPINNYS